MARRDHTCISILLDIAGAASHGGLGPAEKGDLVSTVREAGAAEEASILGRVCAGEDLTNAAAAAGVDCDVFLLFGLGALVCIYWLWDAGCLAPDLGLLAFWPGLLSE